ncbi:DUF3857 domain-containing protein [Arachidicoccus terrestris]|uniref:DUF3857 domain-containing protein n=1 Tax=Arachidicoccus terrestris TaxID=2875539 RepID=UPI001CC61A75|nr:DUF3857 domain-containing protein [Arachidicoccus terrestris]UAY54541.1 DUF3857 and transglutaminase domain-containing protein [Arachidicoccus terrestris]
MRLFYKLSICIITISITSSTLPAQESKYPTSGINAALLKDANSVVRLDNTQIKVKDAQNAAVHYHQVYTVLNPKADRSLIFTAQNSKFMALTDATIHVYNKDGIQIQQYSKKDLMSSGFGEGLIDDGSITYFKVSPPSYPITVEYDYTVRYKGILQYPAFVIQMADQSVEESSYQISIPTQLGFRFKNYNTEITPEAKTNGVTSSYSWKVKNLPALSLESNSGPKFKYLPVVFMAADHFSMDDYEGKMDSWAHFGDWVTLLNKNDAALKPDQIAFYQAMTAEASTPERKARILYDYLQQNMRYVSIQLGIGGWKPMAASVVSTKKYGDCKALSHFMQAALAAVGIKSYPVLINMERPDMPISADFPIYCFNHEILCIPQLTGEQDTTWLECTSSLLNFGTLGYSTAGNYGLLLTPDGGKLIQTPATTDHKNTLTTTQHVQLRKDGSAVQHSQFAGTGAYKELFLYQLYQKQQREKKDFLDQYTGLKQTDSISITEVAKGEGPYNFEIDLKYDQYPDFSSGNKLFVSSRPFSRFIYTPEEDSTRKADFYFPFPYQIKDTTIFLLEEGLHPESLPEGKNERYDFGNYTSQYSYDADARKLTIVSQLDLTKQIISAADFSKLTDFAESVEGDIQEKIIFIKE